jgi:hypothetical protein
MDQALSNGPKRVRVSHPLTYGWKQAVSKMSCCSEFWTMGKVKKTSNPETHLMILFSVNSFLKGAKTAQAVQ